MLVYDNILLNIGFVIPCSMNIEKYSIFLLDNVDARFLAYLKPKCGDIDIDEKV